MGIFPVFNNCSPYFGGLMNEHSSKFDVLIVGAGINGLAAAYHLSKHKNLKVGLVEQFSLGHPYGSSHGLTRIFRSTYLNPVYAKLARYAQIHEWPSLEKEAECKLLYPSNRCLFGNGPSFDAYSNAILKICPDLKVLDVATARSLFPQFRFPNSSHVLQDNSSGVIAAKDTMEHLAKLIVNKVDVREQTKVLKIDPASKLLRVETTKGPLMTERLVITAGPWMRQFISPTDFAFAPIKQVVGYFKLKGLQKSYKLGQFPTWVYIGEVKNNDFYGLPEFDDEGIKVAQEIMSGETNDPDKKNSEISPDSSL